MTLSPARPELSQRYRRPGRLQRLVLTGVVVVLTLVALGWLGWAAYLNGTPPVQGTLNSFDVTGPHEVTAHVLLATRDGEGQGHCLLRAMAADHAVVGERTIDVPLGSGTANHAYVVRTERTAAAVELLSCTSR